MKKGARTYDHGVHVVSPSRFRLGLILGLLLAAGASCSPRPQVASAPPRQSAARDAPAGGLRVLAWNVAENAFVRDGAAFRAHVMRSRADLLLFDEVHPDAAGAPLAAALAPIDAPGDDSWQFVIGDSGGRQRGVIASRLPLERVPELSGPVPYPAGDRARLEDRMIAANQARPVYTMADGIPISGAIVRQGTRRVLAVTVDLQCCGDTPDSWQEERRRVETREIRQRIAQVLARTRVDAVIVSGDLNLVNTPTPLVILTGPYPPPHHGLLVADLAHLDGVETWTWDGRGTPYPSRPMDFLLYDPRALELREGHVLDWADVPPAERAGLDADASKRLSDHRPLVAAFAWR
jgi:hypothetical protein